MIIVLASMATIVFGVKRAGKKQILTTAQCRDRGGKITREDKAHIDDLFKCEMYDLILLHKRLFQCILICFI